MSGSYEQEYRSEYSPSNVHERNHFLELVETYLEDEDLSTIMQTGMNMTYSMINVGIVTLPVCAYHAGIPLYAAGVIFFAALSSYVCSVLVEMADDRSCNSLESLANKAFGTKGYYFTCLAQLVFSFLIICITLGEWGNVIFDVIDCNFGDSLPSDSFWNIITSRNLIILFGSLLALPGSFSRSFSTLSWTSVFTVIIILVAFLWSFYVLFRYLNNSGHFNGKDALRIRPLWWTSEILLLFCLSFQHKLFFVFNCLRRKSVRRFAPTVQYSHFFVAFLYIAFGCMCAMHIEDVDNLKHINYFREYEDSGDSKAAFDIVRTVLSLALLFTIPAESLAVVSSLRNLFNVHNNKKTIGEREYDIVGQGVSPQGTNGAGTQHGDDKTICCFELSQIFGKYGDKDTNSSSEDDTFDATKPVNLNSLTRHTVSTVCLSDDRTRSNTFDNNFGNTWEPRSTEDSSGSKRHESILKTNPTTPTPHRKSVSFQDDSTPPREMFNDDSNFQNTSIHLSASSPYVLSQNAPYHRSNSELAQNTPPDQNRRSTHSLPSPLDDVSAVSTSLLSDVAGDSPRCSDNIAQADHKERIDSEDRGERLQPFSLLTSLPIFAVWLSSLLLSMLVYRTLLFIALCISAVVTSMLMFVLPSMLYFRLGLTRDFESIPICGVLPNRLMMFLCQLLGLSLIAGNLAGIGMLVYDHVHSENSSVY